MLAGCWAGGLADGPATPAPAGVAGPTDEAPDELTVLVRPRPVPPTPPPPLRRQGRFGLRTGYLVVTEAREGDWDPAVAGGVFYRSPGEATHEFGIDYASLVGTLGEGEAVESKSYHFRWDVMLRRNGGASAAPGVYLLGGASAGVENGVWGLTGDRFVGGGGAINAGLGVGPTDGHWDARVVYSAFVVSEGIRGAVLATFGVPF